MAFNVPINSIAPNATPPDWVRPADWISITDTVNEVQFLVCDLGAKAFTINTTFTRTSGNIYIDWGDGVVDTISNTSLTSTSHVYSTGGTPCSRGYNTWKIRIYGDATCAITNARHVPNFAVTGGNPYYSIGLLEAYFGNSTCGTSAFLGNYFTSNSNTIGNGTFNYLEYVKLPATASWTSQMNTMFQNCVSLYVVVMPISANSIANLQNVFNNCSNLLDIVFPSGTTSITSLQNAFSGCTNLRSVSFPTSLNSVTTASAMFNACVSIKNITLPSINVCTDFSSFCSGCNSLQWFKFLSLPSPAVSNTTITTANAFGSCVNLQNVYFPSTCSSNAVYSMSNFFSSCNQLKNVIFPINFNASTLGSCFSTCQSLTTVTFQSAMSSLTAIDSAFNSCYSLKYLTLPNTVGSTISMASTFSNCFSLEEIVIPSGWVISSLSNTFFGCSNLISASLPNNAQDSCTTMATTFYSCSKLKTVVMPTSLNNVTSLSSTFGNCYNLTSVQFPSSINSVTLANSLFSGCYELVSVTMPTSMSSCTDFNSAFSSCRLLKNLVMPSIVSTSLTTYASLVLNCHGLITLTLPTTQTSSVTNISSMLSGCSSLTTINNLNKIGSLTATPLVSAGMSGVTGANCNILTSISLSCPLSQFSFIGTSTTTNFNKLNSLRLLNTSTGQWTGTSPQINISFCNLSTAALNTLFADIAAQGIVTSKTINITSCTGAAGLSAADRLVLTSRGWTITG